MQDRLKFRVWDKYFNRYWTDEEVKNNIQWLLYPDNDNIENVVIEQASGLKDKNGNILFEGAVCYDDWSDGFGEILFDKGKFIFSIDDVLYDLCDALPLELYGNIHENHELLEKKYEK